MRPYAGIAFETASFSAGTEGSNPVPSSVESSANLTPTEPLVLWLRAAVIDVAGQHRVSPDDETPNASDRPRDRGVGDADDPPQRPYSCKLLDDAERKCAFGQCDAREIDRLRRECFARRRSAMKGMMVTEVTNSEESY
jgi:hypothetical protein